MKLQVLILCTGNSARSQMAEGLLRSFAGEQMDVFSAGSKPSIVSPYAIQAMAELGIDITQQRSKHLNEYLKQSFDYVITVCDQAAETCPIFPGKAQRIHWSFPDPAAVEGSDEDKMRGFHSVRDALAEQFKAWAEDQKHGIE
jgi:arsenate reductase